VETSQPQLTPLRPLAHQRSVVVRPRARCADLAIGPPRRRLGCERRHQARHLFASGATYEARMASSPREGLVARDVQRQTKNANPNGVTRGLRQRTTGPNPFDNAFHFDPVKVTQTAVGSGDVHVHRLETTAPSATG